MGTPRIWKSYVGKAIVVDTDSDVTYLGRLVKADNHALVLEDVDLHNRRESTTPAERYLIEAKKAGLRPSRRKIAVLLNRVVGISLLDDIVDY